MFRGLHTIGVWVGDVNPSNILVSDGVSVMLIDCDSFQYRADRDTSRIRASWAVPSTPRPRSTTFGGSSGPRRRGIGCPRRSDSSEGMCEARLLQAFSLARGGGLPWQAHLQPQGVPCIACP